MNDKLKNNAELFCIIPAAGKSTRYKKSNKIFECIEEELDILNASILNINNLGVVKKTFVGYDDSSKETSDFKDIIQSDLDQDTSLESKNAKRNLHFPLLGMGAPDSIVLQGTSRAPE